MNNAGSTAQIISRQQRYCGSDPGLKRDQEEKDRVMRALEAAFPREELLRKYPFNPFMTFVVYFKMLWRRTTRRGNFR
jgi:hypothetical protein